eukprot:CAMPEP_0175127744 /NCGR_PEP_ID=MMETSP0087-20121206/4551_1 /TAXON_ID=136419 /ORGANISM="Unknown Unknown, Strain D1" /LENGTH=900 /DNA_ID=CAMNT_0016409745 /DNA_START=66 /DNA_END=2768 /DNA_ORIENTATION=+
MTVLGTLQKIVCPNDSEETELPDDGLPTPVGLPKDTAVLAQLRGDSPKRNCDVCETEHPATHLCVECNENMCEKEANGHTRYKATRHHHVLTLAEVHAQPFLLDNSFVCAEHGEPFRYYCLECQLCICVDCATVTDHKNHEHASLEEQSAGAGKQLEVLEKKVRAMASKISKGKQTIEAAISKLQKNYDEEKSRLTSAFADIRAATVAREAELCRILDELHQDKLVELTAQQNALKTLLGDLSSAELQGQQARERADPQLMLSTAANVNRRITTLQTQPPALTPQVDTILKFQMKTDPSPTISASGEVFDGSSFPGTSTMTVLPRLRQHRPGVLTITARDRKGEVRGTGGDLFEAAVLDTNGEVNGSAEVSDQGDGTYQVTVVAFTDNVRLSVQLRGVDIVGSPCDLSVQMHSLFIRKWGRKGADNGLFNSPSAVCVSPEDEVFVVDTLNHRIQVFSMDGKFKRRFGKIGRMEGQLNSPNAICFSKLENELYVIDAGNWRIQVFRPSGDLIRAWGSQGSKIGQFLRPHDIYHSHHNEVFITEENVLGVMVFRPDGHFLRKWKWFGKITRPPKCRVVVVPAKVQKDSEVFVLDNSNSNVQVFQPDGMFLRNFSGPGEEPGQFRQLFGVAISSSGKKLFITDSVNNRVTVMKPDGTFFCKWGSAGHGEEQFRFCGGVALSASGALVVADPVNHCIQVFKADVPALNRWARFDNNAPEEEIRESRTSTLSNTHENQLPELHRFARMRSPRKAMMGKKTNLSLTHELCDLDEHRKMKRSPRPLKNASQKLEPEKPPAGTSKQPGKSPRSTRKTFENPRTFQSPYSLNKDSLQSARLIARAELALEYNGKLDVDKKELERAGGVAESKNTGQLIPVTNGNQLKFVENKEGKEKEKHNSTFLTNVA